MAILSPELEAFLPRLIQIESGGDPNARTGSYTGLLQMGPDEIAKYGGNDLAAGKALLADRAAAFESRYGRQPSPTELYLMHQQGVGGAQAHLDNPDRAAWENMYSTAEGQKKGPDWAKKAIWGNVPDDVKKQYPGGVDSLTSRDFVNIWRAKVEGGKVAPQTTPLEIKPQDNPLSPYRMAQAQAPQLPAFGFTPQVSAGGQVPPAPQVAPLGAPNIPPMPKGLINIAQYQGFAPLQW